MSRDVNVVLAEKERELRIVQQQVLCLRTVLPLFLEDGEKLPQETEPKPELRVWP